MAHRTTWDTGRRAAEPSWQECAPTQRGEVLCLRAGFPFGSVVVSAYGATFFVFRGSVLHTSDLRLQKRTPLRNVAAKVERFLRALGGGPL